MKTKIISLLLLLLVFISAAYLLTQHKKHQTLHVAIITPIEHPALKQIVSGFTKTLQEKFGKRIFIEVQNAQGDLSIQSTIIQNFSEQHPDLLVTVATQPTQMALQQTSKEQAILFLAASQTVLPSTQNSRKLAGIIDEVEMSTRAKLLQEVLPKLHKISVVYSLTDKILPEVQRLTELLGKKQITVQKLGIQKIADLYQIVTTISEDTDAIFILEDLLVTSGIQVLVKQADHIHRPLIASDETSVSKGASFALSVRQEEIGIQGAELAATILNTSTSARSTDIYRVEVVKKIQIFSTT